MIIGEKDDRNSFLPSLNGVPTQFTIQAPFWIFMPLKTQFDQKVRDSPKLTENVENGEVLGISSQMQEPFKTLFFYLIF
jgi:hypothetical protein